MFPSGAALLVLALSGTAPAPASGGALAFETARGLAQKNVKTPSGKRYQAAFAKAFSQSQTKELGRCIESQRAPDLTSFEALIELDSAGAVEEVLVRPDTNIASCLQKSIRSARFPKPPRGHYWNSTTLRLSR